MPKVSLDWLSDGEKTSSNTTGPIPENKKIINRYIDSIENGKFNLNMNELRKCNIFFATPCYGGLLTDQFFLSMFRSSQQLTQLGVNFRINTLRNESLITRARNILTAMFLESDCTHLMFIDADIEFTPESIVRMISMDKPIIAGAYPKKTVNWGSVVNAAKEGKTDLENYQADYAVNLKFTDNNTKQVKVENGAIELLDASTGFFLIQREVVEKMITSYPELHYVNDSNIDSKFNKYCYSLFDTIHCPDTNRYLSEDYAFCRRAQKIGISVWLDPNTQLNHVGSYTFKGDVSKIFNFNN